MYEDRANELISMVGKSRNEWRRKYEAAEDENERLKAERDALRAALTTIQIMARNGADLGDADEWTSLFLTEIAAYAEAALRGEGGQSQGVVETFDQLREAIGHYFDDIDDVEKYVNEELRGEGGEDG